MTALFHKDRPRLLLVTGNKHKLHEVRGVLGDALDVVSLKDVGLDVSPEETGTTFEDNALIKARAGFKASGMATLADDSGLMVDHLDGLPGVRSARFAQDHQRGQGDAANNALLLEKLLDVPEAFRAARFVCVLGLCGPGVGEQTWRGTVEGRIGHAAHGAHGFGYDPLFILPDGRTMAQLSDDEKNLISHRGNALRLARDALVRAVTGAR